MSTWMPQPCMSQGCLFQKVTSPGQFWEMASRIRQNLATSQKSDESKRWVSLHAQKYWCALFLAQIKRKWGWRGWKRRRLVWAQGMRVNPQPLSAWADPTPALPTPTNVQPCRLQNLPCDSDKPGPPHHHSARTSHHGARKWASNKP